MAARDLARRFLAHVRRPAGDGHVGARLGESLSDHAAEAAAAPGDERAASVEAELVEDGHDRAASFRRGRAGYRWSVSRANAVERRTFSSSCACIASRLEPETRGSGSFRARDRTRFSKAAIRASSRPPKLAQ